MKTYRRLKASLDNFRLEKLVFLLMIILLISTLAVTSRAQQQDPPNTVYVYNSDTQASKAYALQQLGLLDAQGRPYDDPAQGDDIRDNAGQLKGHVIRNPPKTGEIIGYASADGLKEAYDISDKKATLRQAYLRFGNQGGTLYIDTHGTGFSDNDRNVHKGGNIKLDGGKDFSGFGVDGETGGGTNLLGKDVYRLPKKNNIKVIVDACWSTVANAKVTLPKQTQPIDVKSVTQSLTDVVGADVQGRQGGVTIPIKPDYDGDKPRILLDLMELAKKDGYLTKDKPPKGDYESWLNELSKDPKKLWDKLMEVIKKHEGKKLKITYGPPADQNQTDRGSYHLDPILIGPLNDSFILSYNRPESLNNASLYLSPNSLPTFQVFQISQVLPLYNFEGLASGMFDFTPYNVTLSNGTLATVTLQYFYEYNPSQIDVYCSNDSQQTWSKMTADKNVDVANQTISVEVSRLGLFAVFAPAPTHSPLARFTENPERPRQYDSVYFDAGTSQPGFDGDDECPITEYHWNFGDGQALMTTTSTARHVYQDAGNYTVTLTVYAPGVPPYIDQQYVGTNATGTTQEVKHVLPVGGYSVPLEKNAETGPVLPYFAFMAMLAVAFVALRRKKPKRK